MRHRGRIGALCVVAGVATVQIKIPSAFAVTGTGKQWRTQKTRVKIYICAAAIHHPAIARRKAEVQNVTNNISLIGVRNEDCGAFRDSGGQGQMMLDSTTAVRGGKLLEKCPLFASLADKGRRELI